MRGRLVNDDAMERSFGALDRSERAEEDIMAAGQRGKEFTLALPERQRPGAWRPGPSQQT
jgi:hypothetical protein